MKNFKRFIDLRDVQLVSFPCQHHKMVEGMKETLGAPNTFDLSVVKQQAKNTDSKTAPLSQVPASALGVEDYPLDDIGNAERLFKKCRGLLSYLTKSKKWKEFDGKRWKPDEGFAAKRLAMLNAVELREIAHSIGEDESDIKRQSRQTCSDRGLNAAVNILKVACAVDEKLFDQEPALLTVQNGVVDLQTGHLMDFDSSKFLTHIANVPYKRGAFAGSFFEDFVSEICCGDDELSEYLRRAFGYGITGETREQVFFIEYGAGSNGKTTLNRAVSLAVSELVGSLSMDNILGNDASSGSDKPTPGLMHVANSRIVFTSESGRSDKLNEAAIKRLTGEGTTSGRQLYGEMVEFTPHFKIFMDTNHLPKIDRSDFAIQRRIVVLPFNATFTSRSKDLKLMAKLSRNDEKEAILDWLIQGASEYYNAGLGTAQAVEDATDKYLDNEDSVTKFLAECVVADADAYCMAHELYKHYEIYSASHHIKNLKSEKEFADNMADRPVAKTRVGKGMKYKGLRLLADE